MKLTKISEHISFILLIVFLFISVNCIITVQIEVRQILQQQINQLQQQLQEQEEKNRQFRESIDALLKKLHIIGDVKTTYYSPYDNVSGIECDGSPNDTATGARPAPGVFAVDPAKARLGSRMILIYEDGTIEVGTALDVGGAVKGNHIDCFRWTYRETVQWGERYAVAIRIS